MKALVYVSILITNMFVFAQTKMDILPVWSIKHPIQQVWFSGGTHGSVQERLIEKGELPDPFYGLNESKFNWIEEHQWEFKTVITFTQEQLNQAYIELYFPGIDTYATLFVNDVEIGKTDNAFRPYSFQVKHLIKKGENTIRMVFTPPVKYHEEAYKKSAYKLPAPNDVHPTAIAPYTRKPQYQFGWDWALRMNTIGLLKPMEIHTYNITRIIGRNIQTMRVDGGRAEMKAELYLSVPVRQKGVKWSSKTLPINQDIPVGSSTISTQFTIENPKLWWPKGQGDQALYTDEWQISDEHDVRIDQTTSFHFGVRTAELKMDKDQWGTMHEISVNGRPIFCKGGDYIPQDVFPAKVTDKALERMVVNMAEANFNMVRVWGGGYYPDDAFFQACDSLGIMVWQDFMFACAMYPGDETFLNNVASELKYQIPRISSHPSVVLFNGNNEVDVAWKNWGFQLKYKLYGDAAKEIEESYVSLFKQLIPNTLMEFTSLPYSHTSPLSNWGKDEFYNHGSQHYWGVWHGKDPMSDFAKKIGRFNAEYGFQSFPAYSTILKFAEKSQWDLDSAVMKSHQKSYVGNGMILKHARLLYGEPKNFEDFVYLSQLTQGYAVSSAVHGHRLDFPRCMGTLYWQVNDCWPAPTWSSMDYYWNWKALHYWVQADYASITVLDQTTPEGNRAFFLVNESESPEQIQLKTVIYDFNGKVVKEHQSTFTCSNKQQQAIDFACMKKAVEHKNRVIVFDWTSSSGKSGSRTYSCIHEAYQPAQPSDLSLKVSLTHGESGKGNLIVTTKKYVRNLWLYSSQNGVHFESNFMDLLPGEYVIPFTYDSTLSTPVLGDFNFKFM